MLPALIDAAEEGKQTVCLVELKARFDERRNIEWSRAMEQAGVHVVYGFANLKIHAKMTLIVRRDGQRPAPLRPHRHRQLQLGDRAPLRGLRPVHRRRGDHRRPGRPVQPPDRVRPPAAVPQDPGGAVQPAQRADRADPGGRASGRRPASARGSASRSTRWPTPAIDRGAVPGLAGRRRRSTSSPAASARCGRACPGCPRRSGCAAWSAASSSTAACSRSRRATRTTYLIGSADLMPRNLDHRIEVLTPVEDGRAREELSTVFDALAGLTTPPGS